MCYLRRRFEEQFADCTGRTSIGDTGAFYFDNIGPMLGAEDMKLFHLKQTHKSFLSLSETMDIFCRAGSVQQAQQSTHLAEGLNPFNVTSCNLTCLARLIPFLNGTMNSVISSHYGYGLFWLAKTIDNLFETNQPNDQAGG